MRTNNNVAFVLHFATHYQFRPRNTSRRLAGWRVSEKIQTKRTLWKYNFTSILSFATLKFWQLFGACIYRKSLWSKHEFLLHWQNVMPCVLQKKWWWRWGNHLSFPAKAKNISSMSILNAARSFALLVVGYKDGGAKPHFLRPTWV